MNTTKTQHADYKAKYLILMNTDNKTRALLFGQDYRYLAEVLEDDGLVLENLVRAGKACAPPGALAVQAWGGSSSTLRCFAL
jgi:hypothetical protein